MASLKNLLLTTYPATPLPISNGGTGATDAATARSNLGATGTVSSIGLSLPATFTVSNSPVTGAGTLTATWSSQTANQVLAAPNGSSGAPTFRALVAADIPTLNQNTTGTAANVTGTVAVANGGTGLTTLTANSVILGNGTSAVQFVAPGTTGNVLVSNGTTWVSSTIQTGGAINDIFYENSQTITSNYTLTSGKNAMSAGDITIADGVTVTIPSGSKWTVV